MAKISMICLMAMTIAMTLAYAAEIPSTTDACSANEPGCLTSDDVEVLMQAKVTIRAGNPTPWTVTPADYSDTMTMDAAVEIGGANQDDGHLFAFVGQQCRGIAIKQIPPFGPYAGKSVFAMTIYANTGGEKLSFKFVTGGEIVSVFSATLESFSINAAEGNVVAPIVLKAADPPPPPAVNWDRYTSYTRFENTMSLVGVVVVDGKVQGDGKLGAFVHNDMRGLNSAPMTPPFGDYQGIPMYSIMLYADANDEEIMFKYKMKDGTIKTLGYTVVFKANKHLGKFTSPMLMMR